MMDLTPYVGDRWTLRDHPDLTIIAVGVAGVLIERATLSAGNPFPLTHDEYRNFATRSIERGATLHRYKPMTTDTITSGSHHQHARLAPSASKRWTTCTASVSHIEACRTEGLVPATDEGSDYAAEGTLAHDLATALLTGADFKHPDLLPDDMLPAVQRYVDYCRSQTPDGVKPFIESQVPLFYDKSSSGTADYAVVTKDLIHVIDYKHGAGVLVSPTENTQLAIYGLSFITELIDDGLLDRDPGMTVRLTIVQPRHREAGDPATWELTLQELEEFCADIEDAVRLIRRNVGTRFEPSEEACQFCPAKAVCRARLDAIGDEDFDAIDALTHLNDLTRADAKLEPAQRVDKATGPTILTDEERLALFRAQKRITGLLSDIRADFEERALRGDPVAGTKLVQGRQGNRAWTDEEAADKLLAPKLKKDERYNYKLISPTQAEALLADGMSTRFRNLFDGLVARSEGRLTITTEDDKRPAADPPTALLTDLDDEEDV